jgi:hypothetical protein
MLTPAWTQLRYHAQQALLWRTRARFVAVAAGRGSGKTELARRRIVRYLPILKANQQPAQYFYALPTYKQAQRVAWRPLLRLIPKDWIIGQPNISDLRIETKFNSTLYVVGLDNPARVEGDQWDGCVVDESCDQKPGHFSRSIVPALSHNLGWCWRIGVPKRIGPGAAEFKDFCKAGALPGSNNGNNDHESYAWSSEDILTEEQIKWARDNLDPRDYNEQYRANWETIGGAIFYAFDEVLNVRSSIEYDPNKPLIIGSDFNVDPMAWVICQISGNFKRINNTDDELYVLDELWVRNTNTRSCLDKLYERFKSHTAGFEFFGDATSAARNTRASESDYMQIRKDVRFSQHVLAGVHYPKHNPNRANRFAACNALFESASGRRRLHIHPRCKNLIKDLNQRGYKENSNEPNDSGDVGHITDALGYIVHRMYPLTYTIKQGPRVGVFTDA